MKILKKMPNYIIFLILTIIYVFCGFMVGYNEGYKDGKIAYMNYINNMFSVEK